MASKVQIAKLALQHVGDRFDITSLSDDTTEAEQVNLVFDDCRDYVLRHHVWKFARTYVSPSALAGTVPAEWTYMFTYPAEAVRVVRIVNPLGRWDQLPPIPFDIGRNSNDVKVILTDEQEPEIEYIKQIENTELFDPGFTWALSWKIAETIAMPLTGDRGVRDEMRAGFQEAMGQAKMDDANEGIEPSRSRDPDWIRSRA